MPVITPLSLTITPATELYSNPIPDANIGASISTAEGRTVIVLDFNQGAGVYARDLGTTFSWPTVVAKSTGVLHETQYIHTVIDVWQPSVLPQPEGIYSRATDWDSAGTPGDKFIQGLLIEADTFGAPKTFFLQDSETLTLRPLNEMPVTLTGQTIRTFSCVTPFVSHLVRVISNDGVEWRIWDQHLVFKPYPSSSFNWQTELTSLGMVGWAHAREINFAYLSTAPVTLTLTFDSQAPVVLTLPSTSGVEQKTKVTLPPNKWKLIGFQAFSTARMRVFEGDIQVKIKPWGSTGEYQIVRPIGGKSATGAAA